MKLFVLHARIASIFSGFNDAVDNSFKADVVPSNRDLGNVFHAAVYCLQRLNL